MNLAEKARRVEANAARQLRAEGYVVHRTVRTPYRRGGGWGSNANDVFACIDLIAKRSGERMRWIQVTAGRDIGRKKASLAKVPWDTAFESVEIWRWIGGEGKRTDDRTGKPRARSYFQVYRLERDYEPDRADRVFPGKGASGTSSARP